MCIVHMYISICLYQAVSARQRCEMMSRHVCMCAPPYVCVLYVYVYIYACLYVYTLFVYMYTNKAQSGQDLCLDCMLICTSMHLCMCTHQSIWYACMHRHTFIVDIDGFVIQTVYQRERTHVACSSKVMSHRASSSWYKSGLLSALTSQPSSEAKCRTTEHHTSLRLRLTHTHHTLGLGLRLRKTKHKAKRWASRWHTYISQVRWDIRRRICKMLSKDVCLAHVRRFWLI